MQALVPIFALGEIRWGGGTSLHGGTSALSESGAVRRVAKRQRSQLLRCRAALCASRRPNRERIDRKQAKKSAPAATGPVPAMFLDATSIAQPLRKRSEMSDMANKITDQCISCGACEPECPNQAISQGPEHYVIDATKCDECAGKPGGPACMAVCPTEAIVKG